MVFVISTSAIWANGEGKPTPLVPRPLRPKKLATLIKTLQKGRARPDDPFAFNDAGSEALDRGLLKPCPTTYTSSAIAAILEALEGNKESAEACLLLARSYPGEGDSELRHQWAVQEIKELTGLDCSSTEGYRVEWLDVGIPGALKPQVVPL